MLHNRMITENKDIFNFIKKTKIDIYLTKVQKLYLVMFIMCVAINGSCNKIINISKMYFVNRHKTSIGNFLSKSKFNTDKILKLYQKFIRNIILNISLVTKQPIEAIIDDTVLEKTRPSSKAKKPSEKCGYHHSHTKGKCVYGYQIVIVLLRCGSVELPYLIKIYDKSKMSKIQMAIDAVLSLPKPIYGGYVLADSWYSSESVMKASKKAGYTYIGAIKTNRVLYPKNYRQSIPISFLAKDLSKDQFDLVTVKKSKYYVYRYVGKINGFKNVVILLCYPEDKFGKEKSLRSFISTNTSVDTINILNIYSKRWKIEVFIRTNKMIFCLKGMQVRSYVSIEKFLIFQMISYTYVASKNVNYNFLKSLKEIRENKNKSLIHHIYFLIKNENRTLDEIEDIVLKAS
jgi:hypothetical protein